VPARTMSAQPRLELVTSQEDLPEEVISPELVLVDPELAERARARLELPSHPVPRHVVPRALPLPAPVRLRRDLVPAVEAPKPSPVVVALPPPAPTPAPDAEVPALAPPVPVVEQPVVPRSPVAEQPAVVPPSPVVERPTQLVAPAAPRRRGSGWAAKLRLLAAGVAIGVVGGIVAADVWMPPGAPGPVVAPTVPPTPNEPGAQAAPRANKGSSASKARAQPAASTPTSGGPAFVWVAVPRASRYEVVFERGGKIVYRATTSRTRLQLPRSWRFQGATHRLERGRYHWTVWPLVKGKRGPAVVSSDYTA